MDPTLINDIESIKYTNAFLSTDVENNKAIKTPNPTNVRDNFCINVKEAVYSKLAREIDLYVGIVGLFF
jgi:hypothetical protein